MILVFFLREQNEEKKLKTNKQKKKQKEARPGQPSKALFIWSQVPKTTLSPSYAKGANFSLKKLKYSTDLLYDPAQVVSMGEQLVLGSEDMAGDTTFFLINTLALLPGTTHGVPSVTFFRTFRL